MFIFLKTSFENADYDGSTCPTSRFRPFLAQISDLASQICTVGLFNHIRSKNKTEIDSVDSQVFLSTNNNGFKQKPTLVIPNWNPVSTKGSYITFLLVVVFFFF